MKELKLEELLRYFLSGACTFALAWASFEDVHKWVSGIKDWQVATFVFLGIPIMVGGFAYVMHRALLYPAICWCIE